MHAQKHFGEVGGVYSTGARSNCDDRGARIELAIEESLHLEFADNLSHGFELGVHVCCGSFIRFFVRQFDHDLWVVEPALFGLILTSSACLWLSSEVMRWAFSVSSQIMWTPGSCHLVLEPLRGTT